MMNPKVSIIVPVYKVEKYLKRCVDSLVGQTLKDIEIILVDDGSPDGCPRMCDDFAAADSRIKVVHKPNGGLGSARNAGLEVAKGEYVAFVDSDDYVDAETYATLVAEAEKHNLDAVFNGYTYHYPDGRKDNWACESMLCRGHEEMQEYVAALLSNSNKVVVSVCMGIYRLSVINRISARFMSERQYLSEDILFNINVLTRCNSVASIPATFYHYCYNGSSLTKTFKEEKIANNFRLYETISKCLIENGMADVTVMAKSLMLDYTVWLMKEILLSGMPFAEKRRLCNEIFVYPEWGNVAKALYALPSVKPAKRMLLLLITHKMVLSSYLFFNVFYRLIKR